jgi:aldose 1-epimerase
VVAHTNNYLRFYSAAQEEDIVKQQPYGATAAGQAVTEYTLTNAQGIEVKILTYGGILAAVTVPDRQGRRANVVLGCADLGGYETKSPYFGCITGRYANRIAAGRFTLDGVTHQLDPNEGKGHLHGGVRGFDKVVWTVTREFRGADAEDAAGSGGEGIELHYLSPDGDQHFPGALDTTVTYRLNAAGELRIDYRATTDQPTVVNLTNHTYWNLGGEGSGPIYNHILQLNAPHYTPVDAALIPTGELAPVEGTPFDFRAPKAVGQEIRVAHPQLALGRGYDHNWVLAAPGGAALGGRGGGLAQAAVLHEPHSGRLLEVWTTEPGIQFYAGNFLDGSIYGTSGRAYRQGEGLALETQHFPDSPNQPDFPSTVLRPGETYATTTIFRFGVA